MFAHIYLALVNPFPTTVTADSSAVSNILNIVFGIIGAISFFIIVFGGFKYVISQGDPQAVNTAKNTIIYAVIGLAVTLAAAAAVNFVLGNI